MHQKYRDSPLMLRGYWV